MSSGTMVVVNVLCQFTVVVFAVWLATRVRPLRSAQARRSLWLAALLSPVVLAGLSLPPAGVVLPPGGGERDVGVDGASQARLCGRRGTSLARRR